MLIQEEKPLPGQVAVPFEKPLVDAVEHLIRIARQAGGDGTVKTEKHWEIVGLMFRMWATLYPEQYTSFRDTQLRQKSLQKNHGIAKEKGAMIQHKLEIPRKFYDMLSVIFPNQKVQDKIFANKLQQRMPLLDMTRQ